MIKRVLSDISVSFQHKDMIPSMIPYDPHYCLSHVVEKVKDTTVDALSRITFIFVESRTFQYYYISVDSP